VPYVRVLSPTQALSQRGTSHLTPLEKEEAYMVMVSFDTLVAIAGIINLTSEKRYNPELCLDVSRSAHVRSSPLSRRNHQLLRLALLHLSFEGSVANLLLVIFRFSQVNQFTRLTNISRTPPINELDKSVCAYCPIHHDYQSCC